MYQHNHINTHYFFWVLWRATECSKSGFSPITNDYLQFIPGVFNDYYLYDCLEFILRANFRLHQLTKGAQLSTKPRTHCEINSPLCNNSQHKYLFSHLSRGKNAYRDSGQNLCQLSRRELNTNRWPTRPCIVLGESSKK